MSPDPVEVVFSLSGPSATLASSNLAGSDQRSDLFSYHAGPVKVPGPWKRGRPKGSKKKVQRSNDGNSILPGLHERSRIVSRPPSFEFINLSPGSKEVDRSARTRIHSHARRNRAGNSTIASQKDDRREEQQLLLHDKHQNLQPDGNVMQKLSILVERYNLHQIPGVDPFNALPMRLEPYMHDLLLFFCTTTWKSLYTLERAAGYNPFAEYWLPLGFTDSAVLHTFIGCADAFISYVSRVSGANRALWHLHRAISIVNRRLTEATAAAVANKSCISSGTLVLVAGIAMFERSNGSNDHWRLHMHGLQQLVRYYGGIESLYSQPAILQKIFRADLYGALDDDLTPFFDGHDACSHLAEMLPSDISIRNSHAFRSAGFNHLFRIFPQLDPILVRCTYQLEEAVMCWSNVGGFEASELEAAATAESTGDHTDLQNITTEIKRPSVAAALQLRHLLTGIQYTLLSDALRQTLASAVELHDRRLGEIVRIGLILFSLSILNERPMDATYGLKLVGKLRRVLEEEEAVVAATALVPIGLQLWTIFLAASVTRGGAKWPDKTKDDDGTGWMLDAFTNRLVSSENDSSTYSSSSMGGTSHRLRDRLSRYLWVPCIHDKLFQRMWSAAMISTSARVTELDATSQNE